MKDFNFVKRPNMFGMSGETVTDAWARSGLPAEQFTDWEWYEVGADGQPVQGFDSGGFPIKRRGDPAQ